MEEPNLDRIARRGADRQGVSAQRPKVFINYRRSDAHGIAWPLYLRLIDLLPHADVFFDNVALRPGVDWLNQIKSNASSAAVLLAVIGPTWTQCLEDHMRRGGEDYVVREIDLALRSRPRVTVIPVLVDDADLPDPMRLPPSIRSLPSLQVERVRQSELLADIDRLVTFIGTLTREQREDHATDSGQPGTLIDRPRDRSDRPSDAVAHDTSSGRAERDQSLPQRVPLTPSARLQLALAPDDQHYEMVIQKAANLVVFVGAGANADERDGPWREDAGVLPDDADIARYLASNAGMERPSSDLAEVAEYARAVHGETELFGWLNHILKLRDDAKPGIVHRLLAALPERFAAVHGTKCYQLIVTPKYDAALERAFREAGEEFDVLVYMSPETGEEGRFKHLRWSGEAQTITEPNTYFELPIDRERRRLTRSVIVRINGAVDDGQEQFPEDNYVITEDHFIDYLRGRTAAQVIPTQILATLKRANYLFLGYAISDWRLRVILHAVWESARFGGQNYWAVQRQPNNVDARLWTQAGVTLYQTSVVDYMRSLCQVIDAHRALVP